MCVVCCVNVGKEARDKDIIVEFMCVVCGVLHVACCVLCTCRQGG